MQPALIVARTLTLVIGALSGLSSAQKKASIPPPDPTPVFRASTSMVTVNVIVTDRFQQPATGLQAKDFSVFEDGKRQTIVAFESHSAAQKSAIAPVLDLPPNQFTNFRESDSRVINIVLFDMLNTPWEAQAYARNQLVKFLRSMPPGERVALFTLGTRLRQVQGFTGDAAVLLESAQQIRPGFAGPAANSSPSELIAPFGDVNNLSAPSFAQALAGESAFTTGYRVGLTVEAIGALSRAVAAFPGRKNLLWLSAGFPIGLGPDSTLPDPMRNVTSYQAQVNRLGIALASSQMAVYPIDVRGLMFNGYDASSGASFDPSRSVRDMSWLWSSHQMMQQIADHTGGEAFYNTNGVTEAMQRTLQRSSHYYTLAYVPGNRLWDGKYRAIRVTTKEPTLALQYRRGYLALPNKRLDGSARLLTEAIQLGFPDSTMLLMKAQALPPDAEHANVRLDYAIVANQLTFVDIPGKGKTATVDFAVAAFDKEDGRVALELLRVEGTLRPQDMRLGFAAHQEISLPPGRYILKVGAIDIANQKIGTIEIPLTVPITRSPEPSKSR